MEIEQRLTALEAEVRALKANDIQGSLANEQLWNLHNGNTRTLQRILSDVEELKTISKSLVDRMEALEKRMEALEKRMDAMFVFLRDEMRTIIREELDRN